MVDFEEINKELKNVQMKAKDIREIKGVLNEKFHLYFDPEEAKVIEKITTPTLTTILKNISILKFGKTGELSIDSFFTLEKEIGKKFSRLNQQEGLIAVGLLQKFLIIAILKIDEADDMSHREKYDILDLIIRNAEKAFLPYDIQLHEAFPNGATVLKVFREKYKTNDIITQGKKARKAIPNKMRSRLQKEINSMCPFCEDEEVEHFEGHHIDEDPSNTVIENLILICRKCHSKIGEGTITREQVELRKSNLNQAPFGIDVYKIDVTSENNCWEPSPNVKNSFHLDWKRGNDFPIFQFHLVNNLNKTAVLSNINLKAKHLYSGMGDLPQPCEVPKSGVYHLFIEPDKEVNKIDNFNGIQIPSKQAVTIQVEVAQKFGDEYENLDRRMILDFTLKFSSNLQFDLPRILVNTDNDNEGIELRLLG